MAKLKWDATGEHYYENGVDHCVLYVQAADGTYPKGVVWNGITGITESPDGAEPTDLWADNIKYATLRSAETFGGTIEAYQSPEEFDACDGTAKIAGGVKLGQQKRNAFGLAYRTKIGNDTNTDSDDGYKLHLVYGATASPSEKAYETENDSPDAITFSWEFDTVPVDVTGFKPTSQIVINSLEVDSAKLTTLEGYLFGTDSTEAYLPLPDAIVDLMTKP